MSLPWSTDPGIQLYGNDNVLAPAGLAPHKVKVHFFGIQVCPPPGPWKPESGPNVTLQLTQTGDPGRYRFDDALYSCLYDCEAAFLTLAIFTVQWVECFWDDGAPSKISFTNDYELTWCGAPIVCYGGTGFVSWLAGPNGASIQKIMNKIAMEPERHTCYNLSALNAIEVVARIFRRSDHTNIKIKYNI